VIPGVGALAVPDGIHFRVLLSGFAARPGRVLRIATGGVEQLGRKLG
jgi:hypothetical protein